RARHHLPTVEVGPDLPGRSGHLDSEVSGQRGCERWLAACGEARDQRDPPAIEVDPAGTVQLSQATCEVVRAYPDATDYHLAVAQAVQGERHHTRLGAQRLCVPPHPRVTAELEPGPGRVHMVVDRLQGLRTTHQRQPFQARLLV